MQAAYFNSIVEHYCDKVSDVSSFDFGEDLFVKVPNGFDYTVSGYQKFELRGTGMLTVNNPITETLGVGLCPEDNTGYVVKHSIKTASLHQYLHTWKCQYSVKVHRLENADTLFYKPLFGGTNKRSNVIEVQMADHKLSVFGTRGSVVRFMDSETTSMYVGGYSRATYTLYDFLILMCRSLKVNLMAYEYIRFMSKVHCWVVTLGLKHDVEADRFWTKMWMEAVAK